MGSLILFRRSRNRGVHHLVAKVSRFLIACASTISEERRRPASADPSFSGTVGPKVAARKTSCCAPSPLAQNQGR